MPPILLKTHADFKELWFGREPESPQESPLLFLIWFVLGDGSFAQYMDRRSISAAAGASKVPIFVCDANINEETPAFCKIRTYPTYMLCSPQKQLARIASTDAHRVSAWISAEVAGARVRMFGPPVISADDIKRTEIMKTI